MNRPSSRWRSQCELCDLRIAFLGTPQFAVPTLEALVAGGHSVVCVYSQPPRPSGRGQKTQISPVHAAARLHSIDVRTPDSLKPVEAQADFCALGVDVAVVVAYGLLLPKAVLDCARLGCFNVHASLLPRWRGAAPIHRAIMAGDSETGVMVMRMEEGLDTGPVLAQWRTEIGDTTTTGELQSLLAREGAKLMATMMGRLSLGPVADAAQVQMGVTYAKKILPAEAHIDWNRPARDVLRQIHGLNPSPGAWSLLDGTRLKISRVHVVDGKGQPGEIISVPLVVACGSGALEVDVVQRAGRGLQTGAEFARGFVLTPGARLT